MSNYQVLVVKVAFPDSRQSSHIEYIVLKVFSALGFREQKLSYAVNVDSSSNHHGRTYGVDMCNSCGVFPLNHLRLNNKTYSGDHTYYKAEKNRRSISFIQTGLAPKSSLILQL